MSEYASFESSFWTGGTGKFLRGDPHAQLLAAYLFTCRHKNMIGLYFLPLQYASHETGIPIQEVKRAFAMLSGPDVRFAHYDPNTEHVWVVSMAKRQVSRSPKAQVGAMKLVQNGQRGPLLDAFKARYGAELERLHDPSDEYGIDTLLAVQDGASIPHPSIAPIQEQNQEQKQNQEQSLPPEGGHWEADDDRELPKGKKPRQVSAAFDAVVALVRDEYKAAYPDPKKQPDKLNGGLVQKLAKWAGGDLEPMRTSLRAYLADPFWAAEGHPFATWAGDPAKFLRKAAPAASYAPRRRSADVFTPPAPATAFSGVAQDNDDVFGPLKKPKESANA